MSESDPRSHLMPNYGTPPIALVRGEGAHVWDDDGKRYLDFCSGIAVNALGHCHPHWVERIRHQAGEMAHCSNLYHIPLQAELADHLSRYTGEGKFLFCNSGAEANEALIKLARLHGQRCAGEEGKRYKVICAENAFHGRTFAGMAATPQEKIQGGFRPMLDGFDFGRLNDLESFTRLIDDQTAAIFLEPIQGEGGIQIADTHFLKELRALCDEHHLLLIIDEVQCGTGRTGHFFSFEEAGIRPDAIGMAKGLGGGFPIGAIWAASEHADLFQPGSHGTTFGGNPLACAAALAVLETIENEELLKRIRQQSRDWHASLQELVNSCPGLLREVRGRGYLVGLQLSEAPLPHIHALREAGLIVPPAGGNVVRLLPPLTASAEELAESVRICREVFTVGSRTSS